MNTQKRFAIGSVDACGLLAALVLVVSVGCNFSFGPALRGSGVAKTESREVTGYSAIEVGNAIEVEATIAPTTDLVVTGDDNILHHLKTEVVGDTLKIYADTSYSSDLEIKVTVAVPVLKELSGSGASRTKLTGATGDHFSLELSGASHCQFDGNADAVEVTLSGASHATLTGSTKELKLECSGASRVTATELTAEKVVAELNGASIAHVHASQELDAEASGASSLRYAGQPSKLDKDMSGASTISAD
jgi:hypothetical protein